MREREEENAKLEKMFADVSLQNQEMKALFAKKGWCQQKRKPACKLWLSPALILPMRVSWPILVEPATAVPNATNVNAMLLSLVRLTTN